MQNRCLICWSDIDEIDGETCQTCLNFFRDKYKGNVKKGLAQFKKSNKYLKKWHSQSSEKEVEE